VGICKFHIFLSWSKRTISYSKSDVKRSCLGCTHPIALVGKDAETPAGSIGREATLCTP
jgi:hypothetical protein